MSHITVLKDEAVLMMSLRKGATVVDATFGAGGHASLIVNAIAPTGTYVGIDLDGTAFASEAAKSLQAHRKVRVELVTDNFCHLGKILSSLNIKKVDAVLADLGWRSEQFESGGKGLSFNKSEPLLMTLGDQADYLFTAADIVNNWDEDDIANVIYAYGEETKARKIARAIVQSRQRKKFTNSLQLANCVSEAYPQRHHRIHPATKTFQALRVAVNDELKNLETFLSLAANSLKPGGRLVVISFHSLEDRIVKHFFRECAQTGAFSLITKRPVVPGETEVKLNPRARSAKLRCIEAK